LTGEGRVGVKKKSYLTPQSFPARDEEKRDKGELIYDRRGKEKERGIFSGS
jgi:hypothetical protein